MPNFSLAAKFLQISFFFLFSFAELSVKPSLNSTLIPTHVQRNSGGAGTSSSGTSTSTGPAVVDGAVASVSQAGS